MRTSGSVVFAQVVLANGLHHRWAPIAECERYAARGKYKKLHRPGKCSVGRTRPVYKLVPEPEPSDSRATPTPITFEDILANVGLDAKPHRVRVDRRVMQATRVKIREYRRVREHDPEFCG